MTIIYYAMEKSTEIMQNATFENSNRLVIYYRESTEIMQNATFENANRSFSKLCGPILIIFGAKDSPIPLLYDKSNPNEI